MLSKYACLGAVALALASMSPAYPQGAVPQAQTPAPVPQQVVAPLGNTAPQNVGQSDEVNRSNPDPAVQRFSRGFDRSNDSFVSPTLNMDINGSGISLPKCVAEAKEGKNCE